MLHPGDYLSSHPFSSITQLGTLLHPEPLWLPPDDSTIKSLNFLYFS
jgi:hypothetical protein